ncbi:MAG: RDD family protein [Gemmatimonadaceae bacterium]|nr:RDD family protein [Gemmatimonadaceae bacterium]
MPSPDLAPLELPAVHALRRLISYLVDYAVILAGTGALAGAAGGDPDAAKALLLVSYFAYFFLLEGAFGLTIGKLLVNSRVVRADGGALGWVGAALRTVSRLVPFEPLSLRKGTLWHDRWTGTRVVSRRVALYGAAASPGADERIRIRPRLASA